MSSRLALQLKGLKKEYGDRVALGPVQLKIKTGQRVALVGANGSGKTTLLRLASGLLDPTEGEVLINDEPAGVLDARAAVSYLPDEPVLYDDLSVREHVEYLAPLAGSQNWSERWLDIADKLRLTERLDDLPSGFSRGLRQKTSLLLGFVRPFDLLLIDEPFVGLDEPGRLALLDLLDEAHENGATIVVASHQLDLLESSTRCVALANGQITFDGNPKDVDLAKLVTD